MSELASNIKTAVPIPQFASVFEDVTLESKKNLGDLIDQIKKVSPLVIAIDYVSSLDNKHTFHLEFNHPDRNLTQKEVNALKQKLLL
jgi:phenylalanyl-tRNA synthetase beta subunit